MTKESITVVYDRKKKVETTGRGKVELSIYLAKGERKYVTIKECSPVEWRTYRQSRELHVEVLAYKGIAENMQKCGEEMTIENYNRHLGITPKKKETKQEERRKRMSSPRGFLDFIEEEMAKENLQEGTLKRRRVVVSALERYDNLNSMKSKREKTEK